MINLQLAIFNKIQSIITKNNHLAIEFKLTHNPSKIKRFLKKSRNL